MISADGRVDQYSGEGSEPGEDTASSSAPGGSPGRVHSTNMVPATPPPPEYRLHHNRQNNAMSLSQRHDDASSPEEMSELSRPLLVKQSMVASIQTSSLN